MRPFAIFVLAAALTSGCAAATHARLGKLAAGVAGDGWHAVGCGSDGPHLDGHGPPLNSTSCLYEVPGDRAVVLRATAGRLRSLAHRCGPVRRFRLFDGSVEFEITEAEASIAARIGQRGVVVDGSPDVYPRVLLRSASAHAREPLAGTTLVLVTVIESSPKRTAARSHC